MRFAKKKPDKRIREIRATDSGRAPLTWNEFYKHYKGMKIKCATYYPYLAGRTRAWIETTAAVIVIDGYNDLEIKNNGVSITLGSADITSIEERWDRNSAYVEINTKQKGNLSFELE